MLFLLKTLKLSRIIRIINSKFKLVCMKELKSQV